MLFKSLQLAIFFALAQQQPAVEITAEPSHHQVLENGWVRVFNVLAPPKATTLVHRHNYDYVFVTLGDTDIVNARVGDKPFSMVLLDGEVRFTKGGFAHAVINNSDHPFHNVTIELLRPSTGVHPCSSDCEVRLPCESSTGGNCPSSRILFQSDQWTVYSLVLPSGATYAQHSHAGPHLAVGVSDLDLRQKIKGQNEVVLHRAAGDVGWIGPVVHSLTNAGTVPARIVTLEFKGENDHP